LFLAGETEARESTEVVCFLAASYVVEILSESEEKTSSVTTLRGEIGTKKII
jgi:hypothetical protein